jgi:hypothetical protein
VLAIADDALGFWAALRQVYAETQEQKIANALDRFPNRVSSFLLIVSSTYTLSLSCLPVCRRGHFDLGNMGHYYFGLSKREFMLTPLNNACIIRKGVS